MRNPKQEFPCQSLESFSGEYYNMENKIFGFQCELVSVKQTCPNYSIRNDQDEAEIQYDRLCILEWRNCEKCGKMSTSLECVCCHEIPAVGLVIQSFTKTKILPEVRGVSKTQSRI